MLLISWVRAFNDIYSFAWCSSVCYFVFTYLYLEKQEKTEQFRTFPIVIAIILGYVWIEIPLRIMDFEEMLPSLLWTVIVIISIIGGAIYYKSKKTTVLILMMAIWIILNSIVLQTANTYIESKWRQHIEFSH